MLVSKAIKLTKTGSVLMSGDGVLKLEASGKYALSGSSCVFYDGSSFEGEVGVRRSSLTCEGDGVVVNGFYHFFEFEAEDCEVYRQTSVWCHENQGSWSDFSDSLISCKGYRTAETATPFIALRSKRDGSGYALQLVPNGAWEIRTESEGGILRVLLGIRAADLRYPLESGETLSPPEVIYYEFDDVGLGAHKLHRYLLETQPKRLPPLIYNSWFLAFDRLDDGLLREQVRAAKELGLEIFTIDAGWFGAGLDWGNQVGFWEENGDIAFHGKMREFFDYVHSQGLGCGLWIEPSRAMYKTKIYTEHPEYFFQEKEYALYDFGNPDAVDYIFRTICGLIDRYGLDMMKLDENGTTEQDPTGCAFVRHTAGYASLMAKLRVKYPTVYFEGCQSGGMSSELGKMRLFDWQFQSDTVNPDEALRIFSGALLRMPAFAMGKWLVVENASTRHRRYDDAEMAQCRLYSSADAKWSRTMEVDPDYIFNAVMTGPVGISCDVAALDRSYFDRLKWKIVFYKQMRPMLAGSVCYALKPAATLDDRHTPMVFQFFNQTENRSLLFVFCQNDRFEVSFVPREICREKTYRVTFTEDEQNETVSGEELSVQGITCVFPDAYRSKLVLLEEI